MINCLVYDDSFMDLLALEIQLENYKHINSTFVSSFETFETVLTTEPVSCVFLDISLENNRKGYDIARMLPASVYAVVYYSSYPKEEYECFTEGIPQQTYFLDKPVSDHRLEELIGSLLNNVPKYLA